VTWRNCNASIALVDEINVRWPKRDKASDGTIGDAAHASRDSDHNPWVIIAGQGVVRARDVDKDGIDAAWIVEELRKKGAAGDPRLTGGGYIIFNRRITSPDFRTWRAYNGSNPHDKHFHVSFSLNRAGFDSKAAWNLGGPAQPVVPQFKFPIVGAIRVAYDRTKGIVGQPDGPEVSTLDKAGRWQEFTNGAIYWHPNVDKGTAHEVHGEILKRWRVIGSELTTGFPTSDELTHGVGHSSHFASGWAIYWSPKTGAWDIHGAFLNYYASTGWENGRLGYPTSAEYKREEDGLIEQKFEKGRLVLLADGTFTDAK